jgi:hypothetical protein
VAIDTEARRRRHKARRDAEPTLHAANGFSGDPTHPEGSVSGTDTGTELLAHLGVRGRNIGVHPGTRNPHAYAAFVDLLPPRRGTSIAVEPLGAAPVVLSSGGQRPCDTGTMRESGVDLTGEPLGMENGLIEPSLETSTPERLHSQDPDPGSAGDTRQSPERYLSRPDSPENIPVAYCEPVTLVTPLDVEARLTQKTAHDVIAAARPNLSD